MTVKIIKVGKYDVPALEGLIKDAIKDLKINLKNKKTAILKPNIVIPAKPGSAIVTHLAITEAVINVLTDYGFDDIIIGEGPGVGVDESIAFELSGYSKLAAKKRNVKLVNLNKTERVGVKWKYGTLQIPKVIFDADLYVNLPKMKTHGLTVVTLAMKNQKGILLNADKQKFHKLGLHEPVAELASVVQPDLNIVDAIVGMDGEGPLNGRKKRVGALVVGTNLVEVDVACCSIMGIEYTKAKHIVEGIKRNIGQGQPEMIGTDMVDVRTRFNTPNEEYGRFLNVYSWRNPYACSMCIDSFSLAVKSSVRHPVYWITFLPVFAYYALVSRINIIQGKHARIPDVKGKVICLGDCTRDMATKNNLLHVKGCPPTSRDVIRAFLKRKRKGF